jgi:RHS repeat-associated protein
MSGGQWHAMLQAAGSLEAEVVCQYVWGARPGHRDELILRDRVSESSSSGSAPSLNERLWSLMDYYDPTSIVNTLGEVAERYSFSAFGIRSIMSAEFFPLETSAFGWNFGFKGQFLDGDTGFYNYGYRYYSDHLGRWMNRDPLTEQIFWNNFSASYMGRDRHKLRAEANLSPYGFLVNNPTNHLDIYGLHRGLLVGYDITVTTTRRNHGWASPITRLFTHDAYSTIDLTLGGSIESCEDRNLIVRVYDENRDIVFMRATNGPFAYAGVDVYSGRAYPITKDQESGNMRGTQLWQKLSFPGTGHLTASNDLHVLVGRNGWLKGGTAGVLVEDYDTRISWGISIKIK